MELEIRSDGKRTKAFCTEMVNVLMQMRRLMKKPERRLSNLFLQYWILSAVTMLLLVLSAVLFVLSQDKTAMFVTLAFSAFLLLLLAANLIRMYRLRDLYLNDQKPSVLHLDETGIEVRREDGQTVRIVWSGVRALRIFRESACFLPVDLTGGTTLVSRAMLPQVLDYVKTQHPEIPVVGE